MELYELYDFKNFMISSWQHLPETIHPIVFTVGFFSLYWYALFFLGGILATFFFARFLLRRGEASYSEEMVIDMLIVLFFGALIGGRVGYVLFYNLDLFLASPLSIISPYDFERGVWTGISGMSYHGGLLGVIVALYLFTRKNKVFRQNRDFAFWQMADFVALLTPVALFFGRLGNFFNVELYGRVTDKPWGMIFPRISPMGALRHPSTLYEAFFEGVVLFVLLFLFRKKMPFSGALSCLFLAGYASLRFIGEYFREPDIQVGLFMKNTLSLGQIFSVVMFVTAGMLFLWLRHQNRAKMIQKN